MVVMVRTSVVTWPYGHCVTVGGQEVIVYCVVLVMVEVMVVAAVPFG